MLLGIDHLVIAVTDLDAAASGIEKRLGLAATGGGDHPTLGTRNRLVWLGDTYLEIVAIADPKVAATSWLGAPVLAALESGGGLASWAIASDALGADAAALRALGSTIGEPIDGERRRPDGLVVRWRLSLPGPLGPSEPPFLIEHAPDSPEWLPGDRAARRAQWHPIGGPVRLEVLELPTPNIPVAIQRLGRTVGLRFRPSLAGGGARDANLGTQIVRLRPVRGDAEDAARSEPQAPARREVQRPAIGLASPAVDGRNVDLFRCRFTIRRSG